MSIHTLITEKIGPIASSPSWSVLEPHNREWPVLIVLGCSIASPSCTCYMAHNGRSRSTLTQTPVGHCNICLVAYHTSAVLWSSECICCHASNFPASIAFLDISRIVSRTSTSLAVQQNKFSSLVTTGILGSRAYLWVLQPVTFADGSCKCLIMLRQHRPPTTFSRYNKRRGSNVRKRWISRFYPINFVLATSIWRGNLEQGGPSEMTQSKSIVCLSGCPQNFLSVVSTPKKIWWDLNFEWTVYTCPTLDVPKASVFVNKNFTRDSAASVY